MCSMTITLRVTYVLLQRVKKQSTQVMSTGSQKNLDKSFNFLVSPFSSLSGISSNNSSVNFLRLFKILRCFENYIMH